MNKQEQKIQHRLLLQLLSNGKRGALINIITGSYVTWYFAMTMESKVYLYIWLSLLYVFSTIRYVISAKGEQVDDFDRLRFYFVLFAINIFINGLIWGGLYPFYFSQMSVYQQFFIILIMVAGITISILSLSASKLCFYLFAIPIVMPLWLLSLMGETVDHLFFSVGLTMYIFIVGYLFHTNHHRLVSNINLLAQQDQLIHDLRLMNERLGVASMTDSLTRLANRGYFNEQLSKDWMRSKRARLPISLLIIDIDFFKEYNDHYGHVKGDAVLKAIADILKDVVVRDTDLSARYGGDELAVILYNTDLEGAQWVAAQIIEEVQRRAIYHEQSPYKQMTVSIGIASILPSLNNDQQLLLIQADRALYDAKANGRNCYSIYQ
ncbi:GGDEF domain-containing protein [Legionella sp. W05-934-2]|jgi:diguanylate cyclase (GGDEF)-like protein|uniref:GGDEF domain-containing protein n=1 Tax=Legionella sp. W05-934-2 TaxID=1198649 RepID=UPI003461DA86